MSGPLNACFLASATFLTGFLSIIFFSLARIKLFSNLFVLCPSVLVSLLVLAELVSAISPFSLEHLESSDTALLPLEFKQLPLLNYMKQY